MIKRKKISNNNDITYQDQVDLFNRRVNEFKSIIAVEHSSEGAMSVVSLDMIINEINPDENGPYFSLSYFYEGLQNTEEIAKGGYESIKFLWWVIICIIKEKTYRSSDDRMFRYLKSLLSGSYNFTIKIVGGQQEIQLKLNDYQKDFVQEQLPFLINQEGIQKIKKDLNQPKSVINELFEKLNMQEKHIDDKVKEYQRKADDLANFIKEQTTKLNFIGLGSAFQTISSEKRKAKNWIFTALTILFLGLIAIPFVTYSKVYCVEQPNYLMAIPFTVIEFMLLYVFRLFYQQYLFVKSELLQVNLRHNLCAFIEDYMEFKKNNKDNTVDLFEQLVFSNIISDEKKVPATVDGLESIANLIQAIKSK